MMKRFFHIILTLLMVLAIAGGCSTMSKVSMPKFSGSENKSDEDLYRKVPASMRAEVKEAEFDLKRAKSNANLATEKFKLTEVKKEREILRNTYAKYYKDFCEIMIKKAQGRVEIQKIEAIDNANLGDRADNIKLIAKLKTKNLGIESDAIGIKADMDTTQLKIKQLTKQIAAREKKVKRK